MRLDCITADIPIQTSKNKTIQINFVGMESNTKKKFKTYIVKSHKKGNQL